MTIVTRGSRFFRTRDAAEAEAVLLWTVDVDEASGGGSRRSSERSVPQDERQFAGVADQEQIRVVRRRSGRMSPGHLADVSASD